MEQQLVPVKEPVQDGHMIEILVRSIGLGLSNQVVLNLTRAVMVLELPDGTDFMQSGDLVMDISPPRQVFR